MIAVNYRQYTYIKIPTASYTHTFSQSNNAAALVGINTLRLLDLRLVLILSDVGGKSKMAATNRMCLYNVL